MRWLPQPANLASPSIYIYCTFRDFCCKRNMFVHLNDCNNRFVLICLVLHELQYIHYNPPVSHLSAFSCKLGTDWLLVFWPVMCHSSMNGYTRILAPPLPWLQKHTELSAHDFVHSPHLLNEPRFGNSSYAWS
jgi:hypothetical protein